MLPSRLPSAERHRWAHYMSVHLFLYVINSCWLITFDCQAMPSNFLLEMLRVLEKKNVVIQVDPQYFHK
jgi:hypothetical protein